VAVSNGAAESAVCWDRDAKGASFRFLVVDEEAVVRGRLLCNGEQPRIQDFARNVQSGRGERDGAMKKRKNLVDRMRWWKYLGVVYRGKRKDYERLGGCVVAMRVSSCWCLVNVV
jgi:hypothetical protein